MAWATDFRQGQGQVAVQAYPAPAVAAPYVQRCRSISPGPSRPLPPSRATFIARMPTVQAQQPVPAQVARSISTPCACTPVRSARSCGSGPAPAVKNPTLTILIRDFEMQHSQLPPCWESDLGSCAQCAQHISRVLQELAQGERVLVPLEPNGPSVPVPWASPEGRPVPDWYQAYAGYHLLADALQESHGETVRGCFRQCSCALSGVLGWRTGEVQGFLRLCFTSFGLPAASCHPAVWYQLIREIAADPEGRLTEGQAMELLRRFLQRLRSFHAEAERANSQADAGELDERRARGALCALAASRGDTLLAAKASREASPVPSTRTPGSAAAPDPQREDVAQLAAASGTSGTASVTACSSPSLASPCRRDGKTFRIAWREGAPEEKAAVPGQEAEPPAPAPTPAPLPAWLDASVGFASFPRRSLHREIEEKPRYPVFCSELEPEALSIGLGSLGTLPEATQGPPLAQSALSPSAAAAPPLAAATMFATTTTLLEMELGKRLREPLTEGPIISREPAEAKLPEEVEVCRLLGAVQSACMDLAQRLHTQRQGQPGGVHGGAQWFDMSTPSVPRSCNNSSRLAQVPCAAPEECVDDPCPLWRPPQSR
ncbi:unnamed protein product [Effrenium voratum]|uniref:Uncharacterized protein n=1 Tax=Effrenium voratum TaxID=2562239 RepID=A0AA36J227_9DINO|nr:unnamed protein product [Effrenium voratum]